MVDRIRYSTVSYLPFYYVFFQFLLLTIFNLQANILTTKDILSNLVIQHKISRESLQNDMKMQDSSGPQSVLVGAPSEVQWWLFLSVWFGGQEIYLRKRYLISWRATLPDIMRSDLPVSVLEEIFGYYECAFCCFIYLWQSYNFF